jgi:ubiquinone/menaquinone biosynthesis C-methylase UbiE
MSSSGPDIERWSGFKVWLFSLFNKTPESNLVAVDWMALGPEDRFLDLGCGLGAALERAVVSGASVAGIDPSPSMVERAAQRVPQAEVRLGSAESIPFDDDEFTAALSVATYHHWADVMAGLREAKRVLAPGGRLLIVERRLKRGSGHGLDEAGGKDLAQRFETNGYVSIEVETMKAGRAEYLAVSAAHP